MFTVGFVKISKADKDSKGDMKATALKGAAIGAGIGAAKNIAHEAYLNKRESSISNTKGVNQFKNKLQKGDVIITGSTPRNSGGIELSDMPEAIQNVGKKFGIKPNTKLTTNSSVLTAIGGGGKYHAMIYLGNGRVGHMSTDAGAVSESIHDAIKGQNAAAYRQGSKAQADSAVKFTRKAIKNKVPYSGAAEVVKEPLSNILIPKPFGQKACRDTKKGMVCHTLASKAYNKQTFSQGARTYSGDLRRNMNFEPVARRDVVKIPTSMKIRNYAGQALKGIKYAIPGAAAALAISKIKQRRKKNEAS